MAPGSLGRMEQKLGYFLYIGDCFTHLYRDYSKPVEGSLLTNQDSMESNKLSFSCLTCQAERGKFLEYTVDKGPWPTSFSMSRGICCQRWAVKNPATYKKVAFK